MRGSYGIAAVEFTIERPWAVEAVLEIVTECDVSGVKVYAPSVKTVRVSGEERGFRREGDMVVLQ